MTTIKESYKADGKRDASLLRHLRRYTHRHPPSREDGIECFRSRYGAGTRSGAALGAYLKGFLDADKPFRTTEKEN